MLGREDGPPPPVDLAAERRNGDFVRGQIVAGRVSACHDVSDGGLLVALAEMAMAGSIGASDRHPRRRCRRMASSSARTRRAICSPRPSPMSVLAAAAKRPEFRHYLGGPPGAMN